MTSLVSPGLLPLPGVNDSTGSMMPTSSSSMPQSLGQSSMQQANNMQTTNELQHQANNMQPLTAAQQQALQQHQQRMIMQKKMEDANPYMNPANYGEGEFGGKFYVREDPQAYYSNPQNYIYDDKILRRSILKTIRQKQGAQLEATNGGSGGISTNQIGSTHQAGSSTQAGSTQEQRAQEQQQELMNLNNSFVKLNTFPDNYPKSALNRDIDPLKMEATDEFSAKSNLDPILNPILLNEIRKIPGVGESKTQVIAARAESYFAIYDGRWEAFFEEVENQTEFRQWMLQFKANPRDKKPLARFVEAIVLERAEMIASQEMSRKKVFDYILHHTKREFEPLSKGYWRKFLDEGGKKVMKFVEEKIRQCVTKHRKQKEGGKSAVETVIPPGILAAVSRIQKHREETEKLAALQVAEIENEPKEVNDSKPKENGWDKDENWWWNKETGKWEKYDKSDDKQWDNYDDDYNKKYDSESKKNPSESKGVVEYQSEPGSPKRHSDSKMPIYSAGEGYSPGGNNESGAMEVYNSAGSMPVYDSAGSMPVYDSAGSMPVNSTAGYEPPFTASAGSMPGETLLPPASPRVLGSTGAGSTGTGSPMEISSPKNKGSPMQISSPKNKGPSSPKRDETMRGYPDKGSPAVKRSEKGSPAKDVEMRAASPEKGGNSPIKGGNSPVKGGNSPIKGEQSPVKGEKSPVKGEKSPVRGSSPMKPLKAENSPVKGGNSPVKEGNSPVKEGNSPVKEGNSPVRGSSPKVAPVSAANVAALDAATKTERLNHTKKSLQGSRQGSQQGSRQGSQAGSQKSQKSLQDSQQGSGSARGAGTPSNKSNSSRAASIPRQQIGDPLEIDMWGNPLYSDRRPTNFEKSASRGGKSSQGSRGSRGSRGRSLSREDRGRSLSREKERGRSMSRDRDSDKESASKKDHRGRSASRGRSQSRGLDRDGRETNRENREKREEKMRESTSQLHGFMAGAITPSVHSSIHSTGMSMQSSIQYSALSVGAAPSADSAASSENPAKKRRKVEQLDFDHYKDQGIDMDEL